MTKGKASNDAAMPKAEHRNQHFVKGFSLGKNERGRFKGGGREKEGGGGGNMSDKFNKKLCMGSTGWYNVKRRKMEKLYGKGSKINKQRWHQEKGS